jgi:hypothetical protein
VLRIRDPDFLPIPDPDFLPIPDPDPDFLPIPDPDPDFLPIPDPDPDFFNHPRSRGQEGTGSRICTTLHLTLGLACLRGGGLHKERPSYRRSLQLSKEAIQHLKT